MHVQKWTKFWILNCIGITLKSTLSSLQTFICNWKLYQEFDGFYTLCTIKCWKHLGKLQLVFNGTYKKWTFTTTLEKLIPIPLKLLVWFLACSSSQCKKSWTILPRFSMKWWIVYERNPNCCIILNYSFFTCCEVKVSRLKCTSLQFQRD